MRFILIEFKYKSNSCEYLKYLCKLVPPWNTKACVYLCKYRNVFTSIFIFWNSFSEGFPVVNYASMMLVNTPDRYRCRTFSCYTWLLQDCVYFGKSFLDGNFWWWHSRLTQLRRSAWKLITSLFNENFPTFLT